MATSEERSGLVSAEGDVAMEVDSPSEAEKMKENRRVSTIQGNMPGCAVDIVPDFPSTSDNVEEALLPPTDKCRIKKNDSGISVDTFACDDVNNGNEISSSDHKDICNEDLATNDICNEDVVTNDAGEEEPKPARKCNMRKTETLSDKSSPDSGQHDDEYLAADLLDKIETPSDKVQASDEQSVEDAQRLTRNMKHGMQELSDEDDDDEQSSMRNSSSDGDDHDSCVVTKPKPSHKWFLCPEVTNRQYGISNNFSNDLFRMRANGSLHMVERLELMYKMKRHEGCVNTLHFNSSGTRLASGSDDLSVVLWDWAYGEHVLTYESGHRSNVFQAKFMPLGNDSMIVSCARDGQVRLAELSSTGVCKNTRRLASHRGPAHKLALEYDSPHAFLSCGEDGAVFEIDLRSSKPRKVLLCRENDRKVPLYTVFVHPSNPYEFAIGGKDHFVRVYDKRRITHDGRSMKKYCPHHLLNSDIRANVTCLVYNYNGSEILASYNDEDIYSFDTSHSDGAEYVHRYQGHRNNATVKGVNYFGSKSEFIVSGSDCGNIYLWEHDSESIIQFMAGDEGGVVNCLEPHPHMPVLATSGLDDDIKIWVPSCEKSPKFAELKSTIRANRKERDDERQREPDTIDGQMLWFLMHHLRRSARRRAREEGQNDEESSTDNDSGGDSDDSDAGPHSVQCATS